MRNERKKKKFNLYLSFQFSICNEILFSKACISSLTLNTPEARAAYKDLDEVVRVSHKANIRNLAAH
jgi:RNA-splicing ligase RtcB